MLRFRFTCCASLISALAGGCAGMAPTATVATGAEYDAIAQAIGTTTATTGGGGDLQAIRDAIALARGTLPAGFSVAADGHVTTSHLGVAYDFTLACAGSCDATTTHAIATLTVDGELALPGFSAHMTRTGSWTLANLASPTTSVSGDAQLAIDAELAAGADPYHLAIDATYGGMLVDTQAEHALGGESDYGVAVTHAERALDLDAQILLHPDHTATLALDHDQIYAVDLTTGATTAVTAPLQ